VEEDKLSTQSKPTAQPTSSHRAFPLPHPRDADSDISSSSDEHMPTVDELAQSFLRAEPGEEIRELEQELESRSEYLQDSVTSSDDGSDEGSAGMGAPLALPNYLRSILNTALDRLSLAVNDITFQVVDEHSLDPSDSSTSKQDTAASLYFQIDRITIDSITSPEAHIEVGSAASPRDDSSNLGKRRMRIENICARLVSDADNFVSMSKISRPPSPVVTRSGCSSIHEASSNPASSRTDVDTPQETDHTASPEREAQDDPRESQAPPMQASIASEDRAVCPVAPVSPISSISPLHALEEHPLAASTHTVDDERFADASSDEGLPEVIEPNSPSASYQSLPVPDFGGSSILYEDDGLLDYALQNDLLNSRFDETFEAQDPGDEHHPSLEHSMAQSRRSQLSEPASDLSMSDFPTVSALGRSFRPPPEPVTSQAASKTSVNTQGLDDDILLASHHSAGEAGTITSDVHSSPASSPQADEDLTESQLFTHDDAESMYMSAVSVAPLGSDQQQQIPGGWASSSTSNKSTASDTSGSLPDAMVTGSILEPLHEVDDGCETPRPGTPRSQTPSPRLARSEPAAPDTEQRKQAKLFLTIDEVTVWFPLGFNDAEAQSHPTDSMTEHGGMDFKPPNVGEDSIFAEMPGSFSNYAQSSTHRRKTSLEHSVRRPPASRGVQPEENAQQSKSDQSPASSLSIEVGSVAGHMDLPTGRIMYNMINWVIAAFASAASSDEKPLRPEAPMDAPISTLRFSIRRIGIAWVENILAESLIREDTVNRGLDLNPRDAIIRLNCEEMQLKNQNSPQGSRAKLQFGKLTISSLDQDLICFQRPRPKSRRSTANISDQLNSDIEIDFEQSKDTRITVVTRPVQVLLDMQRLDDALSSFGGFSGVLELSNSMSSAHTTTNSPVTSPVPYRPRGVHFGDTPSPIPMEEASISRTPKVQVQFGEVALVLKGKSCAVKLQTTSVRIAMRESDVRVKISEMHLSGPYLDLDQTGAPLLVDVRGTTVNFLFAPEESDLARLISMITPSKDPYEHNDDILIDTLLRQRRKGSVLRIEVSEVGVRMSDLQQMQTFDALGAEIARLLRVTKYLPDDDRPGLLTLATIQQLDTSAVINEQLGDVSLSLRQASLAHVGVPALLAAEIGAAEICRGDEVLLHEVIENRSQDQLPAIMVRMVGDEMEPIVKAKLFNVCVEYRVSTLMAALGISEDGTVDEIALGIAASVATITGASSPKTLSRQSSQVSSPATSSAKQLCDRPEPAENPFKRLVCSHRSSCCWQTSKERLLGNPRIAQSLHTRYR
jgi:autophagy-related protein 2